MKQIILKKSVVAFFLLIAVIYIPGCQKKTTEEVACKTCKAFGVDGLIKEEEVCTEEAEASFRNTYAGKEISCR